jgi:ABC-type Zn uptake system ZnuABC Zn-binding protein ZnuA
MPSNNPDTVAWRPPLQKSPTPSKEVNRLRRAFTMALLLLVLTCALSGCKPLVQEEAGQISIYATFYPIYALTDAVMQNVADASLHCLVQPQDGCLRAYQLSDWDVALLTRGADAVIAGGRGLESFENTLFSWGESGPAVSAVLYNLELYEPQQRVDGEAHSHFQGPNPHLYMSLDGAAHIVESISATMVSLDPDYSELYIRNSARAVEALRALLDTSRNRLAALAGRRVALMSEALIYVARDYALEVADWIERESSSAFGDNELAMWLERLEKADVNVVLIEKQASQALVESLEAHGFTVALIDVLSTHVEGEGFDSYLEIQRNNVQAILDAFECADSGRKQH